MSLELKRISGKLAMRGFQSASNEIESLVTSLEERGLLPDQISILKRKHDTLSGDLASNINTALGSKLPDDFDIRNLSRIHRRGAKYKPQPIYMRDFKLADLPIEWTNFIKQLSQQEKAAIERIINSLSRSGYHEVRDIRESSIETLCSIRLINEDSAVFAKAIFAKKEEEK